jgi:hypothetical protein
MSNIFLAYPNKIDSAAISGGSWSSSLPLTNLRDRQIGLKTRSTDDALASAKFEIDLGDVLPIRVLALVAHNLESAAKIRISAGDSAGFSTTTYTSDWVDVYPSSYLSEMLEWESDLFWYGQPTLDSLVGGNRTYVHMLAAAHYARYWRVEIDDTLNTAGYIEIGRLFAGDGWQPQYNMSYGSALGYEDASTVEEAWSGAEYFDRKTTRRVMSVLLEHLTDNDAMMRVLDLQRAQGTTQEILVCWDPADTTFFLRRSFLARASKLDPIAAARAGEHRSAITFRELL